LNIKRNIVLTIISLFLFSQLRCFSQDINIAFTIDNNYPIFTLLAINSILKNNHSGNHYNFYIVNNNITDKNKLLMKKFVEDKNQTIEFIQVNPDIITKGKDFYQYLYSRITSMGMVRILLPEILPDNMDRVLYLDGDILVTSDIAELYNTDLGDKIVAMSFNKSHITVDITKYYCNSGVILMDIGKWKAEKITDKMLLYIEENKEKFSNNGDRTKVFKYPDQDLINIVLEGKIKFLERRWNNVLTPVSNAKEMSGLNHFIGPKKPWDFPRTHNSAFKLYYKYWNDSPLRMYKYYYILKSTISRYINSLLNIPKYLVRKVTGTPKEQN